MIFVAPLRLTDAYEAVTLLLPGAEGTLPLLALGVAGAIPVGAFLAALPRRIQNRRQGCTWRAARPGSACMALREALCCCWAPVGRGRHSLPCVWRGSVGALSGFAAAALLLLAACRRGAAVRRTKGGDWTMTDLWLGSGLGLVLGWIFQRAGLARPHTLKEALGMRQRSLWRMLLIALGTATVCVAFLGGWRCWMWIIWRSCR